MDEVTGDITPLSQDPSDNKEEGWLKTKAKCFMRYVTVVVKVVTLIGGVLIGVVLFPIPLTALAIAKYRVKVNNAIDNEKHEKINRLKIVKESMMMASICIPIIGPIVHFMNATNKDSLYFLKGDSDDSLVGAHLLSIPFIGAGIMSGVMLGDLFFYKDTKKE